METRLLEQLGLTGGEIKVYLALLKLGTASSGPISGSSGVTQAKVYPILDRLQRKGMASRILKNGVMYFQAVEPGKLMDYLHARKQELDALEDKLEEFLPKLETYRKAAGEGQTAMIYQGIQGMKTAHEHTYLKLGKGDEYCVLGVPQYPPWEKSGPEGRFRRYWEKDHARRAGAGIGCRMLFNTDASRDLLKKRNSSKRCEARYMPIDMKEPAYFTIYDGTVLITIISADPICIEIVSGEVADAFKAFFEEFWKLSKPFK